MDFDDGVGSRVVTPPASRSWDAGRGGFLVDSLLSEQGDLSAVERFAQFHEDVLEPLQGRYYSALLPASPPGPGQQLAFEVDLDRCSGCKACVAACHTLNGLDEGESWREVGLVVGGLAALPVIQHVTSSCHHCLDPACLTACPVNAYEKDPVTGIVKHLDDQCFGCQYCTLACPYDAPKFHPGKGIVRKCDMCGDRLKGGEAPACVQACPHEAIRITVVDRAVVRARAEAGEFVATASDPAYTAPTTRYRSLMPVDFRPADEIGMKLEHAHMPLVIMLMTTQLSAGGFLVALFARLAGLAEGLGSPPHLGFCLVFLYIGLAASLFHLGRPLFAYRAILGLRHSWLSREVLAFGLFAKLATALVAAELLAPDWMAGHAVLRTALLVVVVVAGLGGVACSVMVYHAVRRPFWQARSAGVKFAGTTLVLGLAAALVSVSVSSALALNGPAGLLIPVLAGALIAASAAKLWFETGDSRERDETVVEPLRLTAGLLRGPLKRTADFRRWLGVAGGVVVPSLAIAAAAQGGDKVVAALAVVALTASIGGELLERFLFFRAVTRPRMPGALTS